MSFNKLNAPQQTEILCLTQNETSNGTQIKSGILRKIKKRFDKSIICIDATSSMGGIVLPWKSADIWFASVQKCFGLPAGMAIMICSPKAIKKALSLNHNQYYNSLPFMIEKMNEWQTTYTPNILNIFLLNRILKTVPHIQKTSHLLKKRRAWFSSITTKLRWQHISNNKNVLSDTVFAFKESAGQIEKIKSTLFKSGILLGNGYSKWKDSSFRIANFPAIEENEWKQLEMVLTRDFLEKKIV